MRFESLTNFGYFALFKDKVSSFQRMSSSKCVGITAISELNSKNAVKIACETREILFYCMHFSSFWKSVLTPQQHRQQHSLSRPSICQMKWGPGTLKCMNVFHTICHCHTNPVSFPCYNQPKKNETDSTMFMLCIWRYVIVFVQWRTL